MIKVTFNNGSDLKNTLQNAVTTKVIITGSGQIENSDDARINHILSVMNSIMR